MNPNSQNYTQYLKNPDTKEAFMAGCQAMADIIKTSSADDVTFLVGNMNSDRLLSMILSQQSYRTDLQYRDARNIIKHSSLSKSAAAAMVLGFMVNDAGYATDETGYVVEDGNFQLMPGKARRPWPYKLAEHKQTGVQISIEEYDNLTPEQQEAYKVVRYMMIWDEADPDVELKRITEENQVYMAGLIRQSVGDDNQNILRYLYECGAGHGELPRGRLYDYRRTIANIAEERGIISKMMATQISEGYVNTIGQYQLAWLQSLSVSLKPINLATMSAYQLASLKLLMTVNPDEMSFDFTDADIMLYRNVNGDGMKGAINPDTNVPASDERCDIYAQKAYICNVLIPRVGNVIIQAFAYLSRDGMIEMDPAALNELFALIKTIEPDYFDNEEDESEQPDQPEQE